MLERHKSLNGHFNSALKRGDLSYDPLQRLCVIEYWRRAKLVSCQALMFRACREQLSSMHFSQEICERSVVGESRAGLHRSEACGVRRPPIHFSASPVDRGDRVCQRLGIGESRRLRQASECNRFGLTPRVQNRCLLKQLRITRKLVNDRRNLRQFVVLGFGLLNFERDFVRHRQHGKIEPKLLILRLKPGTFPTGIGHLLLMALLHLDQTCRVGGRGEELSRVRAGLVKQKYRRFLLADVNVELLIALGDDPRQTKHIVKSVGYAAAAKTIKLLPVDHVARRVLPAPFDYMAIVGLDSDGALAFMMTRDVGRILVVAKDLESRHHGTLAAIVRPHQYRQTIGRLDDRMRVRHEVC